MCGWVVVVAALEVKLPEHMLCIVASSEVICLRFSASPTGTDFTATSLMVGTWRASWTMPQAPLPTSLSIMISDWMFLGVLSADMGRSLDALGRLLPADDLPEDFLDLVDPGVSLAGKISPASSSVSLSSSMMPSPPSSSLMASKGTSAIPLGFMLNPPTRRVPPSEKSYEHSLAIRPSAGVCVLVPFVSWMESISILNEGGTFLFWGPALVSRFSRGG
mmetsp:Transcript_2773/g.5079  ORF Transcript_2773/g.5079 Transcript_2773/m.5079 type:complete len:219 (+) Transcript_2773:1068-1724(+)